MKRQRSIVLSILMILVLISTSCGEKVIDETVMISESTQETTICSVTETEVNEFTPKEIVIDYYKIPDTYLLFLTDEEIAFYNSFVTAWLNYEPYVECGDVSFSNMWGLLQECFLVVYGDFNEDVGFDYRDNKIYIPYQSTTKEEHDAIIKNFEDRVHYFFDDVDSSEEGVSLIYHLYNSFNRTLDYSYFVLENNDYSLKNTSGYTAMMEGKGICSSYGKAFAFLVRQAGFEAFATSAVDHGWSTIKIDDKYYFADPTWDRNNDPENYEYFLFGLDKRESDGYMESDMYICCNGDNKLSEYVTIERLDYPYKPN